MFHKLFKAIALTGLIACTFGCQRHSSGTYLVYKIEPDENSEHPPLGYSDSIFNILQSSLAASKYQITFNDKFVIVKSLKRNTEAVLAKTDKKGQGETYRSEEWEGSTKVTTVLKYNKEGEMLCIVDLERPFLPGESPDDFGIITFHVKKRARAVCYLSEVKQ